MKFTPFGLKYDFGKNALTRDFPSFMFIPLRNWISDVLHHTSYIYSGFLRANFRDMLQLYFREEFPQSLNDTINFVLSDTDRTTNFLAFCLQNVANQNDANVLEYILSQGGSAYEITKTEKDDSEYDRGVYDLIERVSPVVKKQSEKALSENELLQTAWEQCYSRNPNYEKVVSSSSDFLEGFLGKKYFPKDTKPQLKKFVHAFEANPALLDYKGSSVVTPKSNLTSLLKEASNIRGQHTAGKGRMPTKDEAEFVLHTTILIWNMHQK